VRHAGKRAIGGEGLNSHVYSHAVIRIGGYHEICGCRRQRIMWRKGGRERPDTSGGRGGVYAKSVCMEFLVLARLQAVVHDTTGQTRKKKQGDNKKTMHAGVKNSLKGGGLKTTGGLENAGYRCLELSTGTKTQRCGGEGPNIKTKVTYDGNPAIRMRVLVGEGGNVCTVESIQNGAHRQIRKRDWYPSKGRSPSVWKILAMRGVGEGNKPNKGGAREPGKDDKKGRKQSKRIWDMTESPLTNQSSPNGRRQRKGRN